MGTIKTGDYVIALTWKWSRLPVGSIGKVVVYEDRLGVATLTNPDYHWWYYPIEFQYIKKAPEILCIMKGIAYE